ncbi:MAG: hypothetical protein AAF628_22865 [Planctomycetota bacterium]
MTRPTLLVFVLFIAAGYWIVQHWEDVQAVLGLEEPAALRAVHLAKADHSLARHLTNEAAIGEQIDGLEGNAEAIGWHAEAKTDRVYLVTFRYTWDGDAEAYYFEVDVGARLVRHIGAGSELATQYDIATPSPR